ncbi:MAG: hypothetical protein J0I12_30800 [Candidatus Eremiobacteraeota bacterium]|nr:hypothetical protein [Candidatus Eremiobacteraeota bacterium]
MVVAIATVLGGLAMMVTGSKAQEARFRDPDTQKLTRAGYLLIFLLLGPAFAFYWWFEHKLTSMGYQF